MDPTRNVAQRLAFERQDVIAPLPDTSDEPRTFKHLEVL
jgi:hypothetical protein